MEEARKAYALLQSILADKKSFSEVVNGVFQSIDKDGSGVLDIADLEEFITAVYQDMRLTFTPDKDCIKELFEVLDEDQSTTISIDELAKFLRVLFEEQLKQLAKIIRNYSHPHLLAAA